MKPNRFLLRSGCAVLVEVLISIRVFADSFVNFETAPTHPITLSPDGRTLAVCNLPDGRVELFDVSTGVPVSSGDIPVGIDPVSVRFQTTNEVWVVNHISSSVSVVDLSKRRIIATLNTLSAPADVVFAGMPKRAFVSCAKDNTVQVFDATTRQLVTNIRIDGERPKAMAVSPDGSKVYVAIFESGNRSTILAPSFTGLNVFPAPGPVEHAAGPYGGLNPPPNRGGAFEPAINPAIPTNVMRPAVSQIVKKDASGRWMDDNNGDWTEFVSGTNAMVSSRIEGWDLADHDLAIVNTTSFEVTYVCGLMNLCMDVAVNPVTGKIAVVGTDGNNERRFQANLKGTFLRVSMALVNPANAQSTIKDLNPHLDYQTRSLPEESRAQSIGDPRGIVWNGSGTRAYVTGMGSRNLVILTATGDRARHQPLELGEGPTGLALDEGRERLYVLNRFSATISVVDTSSETVVGTVPFFDPTPTAVKAGRPHFYDTRRTSGLGHVSCASCHPDGKMDRLAWDLGDPEGNVVVASNAVVNHPELEATFHPMKGPMVTQTLQDIIGHEPFHWRGDRAGIEQFNQTFTNLLGADRMLSEIEMDEFKEFLGTIEFPPNRYRNFDDTLSTNVPLEAQDLGLPGSPSEGNAVRGRGPFLDLNDSSCVQCHVPRTGASPEQFSMLAGLHGEHHLGLFRLERSDFLPFKAPQLRNLAEKIGMDFSRTNSRAGFGFTHDGRVDTLGTFLDKGGFNFGGEPIDLVAFLLSNSDPGIFLPISGMGTISKEVASSVGKQLTITDAVEVPLLRQMLMVAESPTNRADLVVRGTHEGINRGWVYDRVMDVFQSDRQGEVLSAEALLALAWPSNELTFTVVPRGSGFRIGVDRDGDGFFDRTELEDGTDATDPTSHATNTPPRLSEPAAHAVYPEQPISVAFVARDTDAPPQTVTFRLATSAPAGAVIDERSGVFTWTPTGSQTGSYRIGVQAIDNGSSPLNDEKELVVIVTEYGPVEILGMELQYGITSVVFRAIPGRRYFLQFKDSLGDPGWTDAEAAIAASSTESLRDFGFRQAQRFYRVFFSE